MSRLPVKKYGKLRYRVLSHVCKARDLENELKMILINQKPDNVRSEEWDWAILDLSFYEGDHFGLAHKNLLETIDWLKEECIKEFSSEEGDA